MDFKNAFLLRALKKYCNYGSHGVTDNSSCALDIKRLDILLFIKFSYRINTHMRLSEIKPVKPKTPEQQRVANLQDQVKRAQQAVKAERARQKMAKAQQSMAQLKQPAVSWLSAAIKP